MGSTYSQIYIQVVFAVKGRNSLIHSEWEERLYQYITGIVRSKAQKMLAINGMPNHIHFFIGMKSSCCLSDLVREIKKSSNEFVNDNKLSKFNFSWQEGYGAFSLVNILVKLLNICKYSWNSQMHLHRLLWD